MLKSPGYSFAYPVCCRNKYKFVYKSTGYAFGYPVQILGTNINLYNNLLDMPSAIPYVVGTKINLCINLRHIASLKYFLKDGKKLLQDLHTLMQLFHQDKFPCYLLLQFFRHFAEYNLVSLQQD